MTVDFSDIEFDTDEGGEESNTGFGTLTEQNNAVNQGPAQQNLVHADPEPITSVAEPATYRDTTDPQKKKELFLASKGIPGPYSRSMREGKWDKYLINPKTGNSVFSEYEQRQAARKGWAVPTDSEGVKVLADSIREDIPVVGEKLASLIMNDPKKARSAIVSGNLTRAQISRAYDLMDKVYAYNKTRQWLEGSEDFSQTYPMRRKEPVKEKDAKTERTAPAPEYTGRNLFDGREHLTNITVNGERISNAIRNKAMNAVNSTLGAAMKMYDKRSISEDIGKWDDKTRRMITDAMRDLEGRSRKSKSGRAAYIMANRLIADMYSEARLSRFIGNNNRDYLEAAKFLGKDRVREIARKVTVGHKGAWRIIDEFSGAKPGAMGHDALIKEALEEEVAKAKGITPPKKRKKRTNAIVSTGKKKENKVEEKKTEEAPKTEPPKAEPPKPKTFGNLLNDDMTEVEEFLLMVSRYKNNPEPFRGHWDSKILPVIKKNGLTVPNKLKFDGIVELGKKTGWDIDKMSDLIENAKL